MVMLMLMLKMLKMIVAPLKESTRSEGRVLHAWQCGDAEKYTHLH
jgi:hypothetical protein